MNLKDRIWVDFNAQDEDANYPLDGSKTLFQLREKKVVLTECMEIKLYDDDLNDQREGDLLIVEGTVHFDSKNNRWVALVEESSFRSLSSDK